jgi:hypothetical protein
MWVMMGIEQPAVNAIVARLPMPKENLAAFGVTFGVALLIEGPIIQLLAAGTALSHNLENYTRLLKFMHIMAVSLTGIHLLIAVTPLFDLISEHLLGIPENLIGLSKQAFLIMFPWSAVIGYRRLWQGVLIRYGKTNIIPVTMIARLAVTGAILLLGYLFQFSTGANIGALSLSAGVSAGAASALFFVRRMRKRGEIKPAEPGDEVLSWKGLMIFYVPLALTSFVVLAIRPVITAGIARAPLPLESLAVWPVIHSFIFLFTSISLSYQEVVVTLLKTDHDYSALRKFTGIVAVALFTLFYLVPLTGFDTIWFRYVIGLPADLMRFVNTPLLILPFMPLFLTLVTWFRGVQIKRRETVNITKGVSINGIVTTVLIFGGAFLLPLVGVITAALTISIAHGCESFYLFRKTRKQNEKLLSPVR